MSLREGGEPIRLVQFNRSFHVGGTEVQIVELVRKLGAPYELHLAVTEEGGPLWSVIRDLGFKPAVFPLAGSFMRANTALQIARIAAWFRRHRIDLVHAQDFYGTLLAVPAARLAGVKVIVGRLDLAHWHSRLQYEGLRQCTRMADHVIANAEAIRQMVIGEGVPAHRVSTIWNGIDLPRFDGRLEEPLTGGLPESAGEPRVIHVANMNHEVKRQEDLIDATSLSLKEGVRFHLMLVGDGPRRSSLEERARALGVADRVHFLGRRPDVPALYRHADVGVLCSSAEGLSNAVMEGMASRTPMVVTKVGGNPDLIEDGKRGLVIEPYSPAALAQAIRALLEDRVGAARMAKEARRFVENHLTLERMVQAHDRLYRRVLGRDEAGVGQTGESRVA